MKAFIVWFLLIIVNVNGSSESFRHPAADIISSRLCQINDYIEFAMQDIKNRLINNPSEDLEFYISNLRVIQKRKTAFEVNLQDINASSPSKILEIFLVQYLKMCQKRAMSQASPEPLTYLIPGKIQLDEEEQACVDFNNDHYMTRFLMVKAAYDSVGADISVKSQRLLSRAPILRTLLNDTNSREPNWDHCLLDGLFYTADKGKLKKPVEIINHALAESRWPLVFQDVNKIIGLSPLYEINDFMPSIKPPTKIIDDVEADKENKPKSPILVSKYDRIQLPNKYWQIFSKIWQREPIIFSEFAMLFKRLGGKIIETGGGSSHVRLHYTDSNGIVIKWGTWRPHPDPIYGQKSLESLLEYFRQCGFTKEKYCRKLKNQEETYVDLSYLF